jgi:hypothetical protein
VSQWEKKKEFEWRWRIRCWGRISIEGTARPNLHVNTDARTTALSGRRLRTSRWASSGMRRISFIAAELLSGQCRRHRHRRPLAARNAWPEPLHALVRECGGIECRGGCARRWHTSTGRPRLGGDRPARRWSGPRVRRRLPLLGAAGPAFRLSVSQPRGYPSTAPKAACDYPRILVEDPTSF